jgi:hypothetical protein
LKSARVARVEGLKGNHALYRLRSLLDEAKNLVKLGREEVERRHDASVRSKVVPARVRRRKEVSVVSQVRAAKGEPSDALFHNLLVVDCIPDVDVGRVWHVSDSRIQVDHIGRRVLAVQMGVESLHEGRLA